MSLAIAVGIIALAVTVFVAVPATAFWALAVHGAALGTREQHVTAIKQEIF